MKCPCCGATMPKPPTPAALARITTAPKRVAALNVLIDVYPAGATKSMLATAMYGNDADENDGFRKAIALIRRQMEAHGWTITRSAGKRDVRYTLRHAKTEPPNYVVRYRDLPVDITPETEARIRNLIKRGFDVPPSKQADYDTFRRSNYKAAEIQRKLGLE